MAYQLGSSTPLLQLVGASSPQSDGTSDGSIGNVVGPRPKVGFSSDDAFLHWFKSPNPPSAGEKDPLEHLLHGAPAPIPSYNVPAGGDAYRHQAQDAQQTGADAWIHALTQPVPEYHPPRINPMEAGLALLIAGGMNAASPYSSEGSRAGLAFLTERDRQAQTDYENRMRGYQAEQHRGQAQYQMGQDQARPLYEQAAAADQAHDQTQLAQDQAAQQSRLAAWTADRQNGMAIFQHRADMERLHQEFAQQVDLLHRQNAFTSERDVQERLFNLVANHPEARGALLTDVMLKHGAMPAEAQRMGKLVATQTPQEAADILRRDLLATQLKAAKMDLANKPFLDRLDQALKQAQINATNASIGAQQANTTLTNKQATMLGTMTPNQKLDWFANQLEQANQEVLKTNLAIADAHDAFIKSAGTSMFGKSPAEVEAAWLGSSAYVALHEQLALAKKRAASLSASGNALVGPIGTGGPATAVPNVTVIPGFGNGVEVKKIGD